MTDQLREEIISSVYAERHKEEYEIYTDVLIKLDQLVWSKQYDDSVYTFTDELVNEVKIRKLDQAVLAANRLEMFDLEERLKNRRKLLDK